MATFTTISDKLPIEDGSIGHYFAIMKDCDKTVYDRLLPAGCVPALSLMEQKSDSSSYLLTFPKAPMHDTRGQFDPRSAK